MQEIEGVEESAPCIFNNQTNHKTNQQVENKVQGQKQISEYSKISRNRVIQVIPKQFK